MEVIFLTYPYGPHRLLLPRLLLSLSAELDIVHVVLVLQAPEYNSYKILRAVPLFQKKGNVDRQFMIGSDPLKKDPTVQIYKVVRVNFKFQ